jgi:hypothetical protein
MEEVTNRRDALTREDVRRRWALGTQPDPSPGELAIDRAHGAVERQAPRSGLGRPEVFHVVGSTTRSTTSRPTRPPDRGVSAARHRVEVVEGPTAAGPPGRSACDPAFTLADDEQAIEELRGTPVL